MTRWAKISYRFEGFHHYPNAPAKVHFLSYPHRHIFHVTVWVEQFHDERDVEYIQFKWEVGEVVSDIQGNQHVESWSCETWASAIGGALGARYPDRRLRIEVLEDGENGALVEMEAKLGPA